MAGIPYVRELDFEYGVVQTLSPLVRRIIARNPGPFTAQGSGTYIVGHGDVAVIDPGPDLAPHVASILAALGQESINHIFVTHTHVDHSGAVAALKNATGAATYGYGPHASPPGPSAEEGADRTFVPEHAMGSGDRVSGKGWALTAVHTPGHTSNHLCYALEGERTLFTGDHVMGWSTSVISPPDGDMSAYMRSLELLLPRDDVRYLPTHGPAIRDPKTHVRAFISHRQERRAAILRCLSDGERTIPEIVAAIYVDTAPALHRAAGRSVLAHLIELVETGAAACDGPPTLQARYRKVL